jgi:hypothetical protein
MTQPAPCAPVADAAPRPDEAALGDLRFRTLLGPEAWSRLPAPVQKRFSKRLANGSTAVYVGEITEARANFGGRCLARLAQAIGGPLPLVWQAPAPSVVTVTEGGDGGQVWTRLYARARGFPQVIHSSKRFAGSTGLEEYVGRGVGMALTVSVEEGALTFRSAFYFLALGPLRLRIPRLIEPGRILVRHAELGDGRFAFSLDIRHPLFGQMLWQYGVFRDDSAG